MNDFQSPQPSVSMAQALSKYRLPVATLKARNRRDELIELFRDRLNAERMGTKYRPLTFMAIKMKVQHCTNLDLEVHYKNCCNAKEFGRLFFGLIKAR